MGGGISPERERERASLQNEGGIFLFIRQSSPGPGVDLAADDSICKTQVEKQQQGHLVPRWRGHIWVTKNSNQKNKNFHPFTL